MRSRAQAVIFMLFMIILSAGAQTPQEYRVNIIKFVPDSKSITDAGNTGTLNMEWQLEELDERGEWMRSERSNVEYEVTHYPLNASSNRAFTSVGTANFHIFRELDYQTQYKFEVRVAQNSRLTALPGSANATVGRQDWKLGRDWTAYLNVLYCRNVMAFFNLNEILEAYDNSTKAGQLAFNLIYVFFLIGLAFSYFYGFRYLRFKVIFPMTKQVFIWNIKAWRQARKERKARCQDMKLKEGGYKTANFHLHMYQKKYTSRISPVFQDEIWERWHHIIDSTNEKLSKKLRTMDSSKADDLAAANADIWRAEGAKEIESLINDIETKTVEVQRLNPLAIVYYRLRALFLREPYTTHQTLRAYPTLRVLHAGLEKHELGGYLWNTTSTSVDRAIENRAVMELERLRHNSRMDWLWNLGTLSPLIGLFGTATGISSAFVKLQKMEESAAQSARIQQLAGGINEALWTTILGLAVSFILLLIYFYYNSKLNWIYSKWEELYLKVSEKL